MSEHVSGSEREVSALWQMYEQGRQYMDTMGLSKKLPTYNRFYEGDQWPAVTRKTQGLPRPVVNLIKMIVRNKKSFILMGKPKITYTAELSGVDVTALNDFSTYIMKEIGQAELDQEAVKTGCIEGTYIYHYYWDAEAVGKDGRLQGGVRCELPDPLSVVFENPTQRDEQKQKWIILVSRETVDSVRAKADKGVDVREIVPDEDDGDAYDTVEQDGGKLCTVITRYFRKNGEVYWEQATKTVQFKAPVPLAPDVEAARAELFPEAPASDEVEDDGDGADAPNNALPDAAGKGAEKTRSKKPLHGERSRAYLYPIVVGQYEPRKRSIYGLGEVEGLIPNQQYVNRMLAMVLLNVMAVSWDKYILHPNALRNQIITNEPGQQLVDYSNTNGQGIKRLGATNLTSLPMQIVDTIMTLTRTVTGSTEVMSGETIGAGISGAAIALLQEAAKHPIADLRDAFWAVKQKQGKVLAQFYKLFYQGAEYVREVEEKDANGKVQKVSKLDTFNGSMMEGLRYDVVCEATTGTQSSSAGTIALLDSLFAGGHIKLRTYIDLYPDDALANKSELMAAVEEMQAEELEQTKQMLQQTQLELQRCQAEMAQDAELVDRVKSIVQENQDLKLIYGGLYAESMEKLHAANEQINAGNTKISEQASDINGFMEALAAKEGIDLQEMYERMKAAGVAV